MAGQVLAGIDGSEGSRLSLHWAMREAAARDAVLQPVTVWQDPYEFGEQPFVPVDERELAAMTRQRLDKVLAVIADQGRAVRVDPLVLQGDPAQVLCARSAQAALLVVGARGRGGFGGLTLGSVSTKCAHHSQCPLVIVPHRDRLAGRGATRPIRRILAAVDGSDGSLRALGWAVAEAALHGAQVEAVTVWREPYSDEMAPEYEIGYLRDDEDGALARAGDQLAAAIARATRDRPGITVSPKLLAGGPARALCGRSAEADLLVVGSRGRGPFARLLLGSVSTACARHSQCPVAIIPGAAAGRQAAT